MSSVNVHPVRVRTSDGWQEMALTGPQGPPGPAGISSIPGEIKLWPGTSLPDPAKYGKWVWADGTSYSSTTYPEAAANIATEWRTAHGVADPGAGNFRVPDLRGVMPVPLDQMPGGARANRITRASAITMAAKTGEEYHTLSLAESPSHTHSVSTGGASAGHVHYLGSGNGTVGGWVAASYISGGAHAHNTQIQTSGGYTSTAGGGIGVPDTSWRTYGSDAPAHTHGAAEFANYTSGAHQDHSHSGTAAAQGGGGAHENLPPTIFVPYIVRLDG